MTKTNKEKAKIRKKEYEIKLLSENAVLPKKAVRGAIGYDLCLPNDYRVPAHSRVAIPLDIAISLPFGVEAKIEPRSGCSLRGIEGYGTRKVIKRKILGIFPITETKSGKLYFDADVCVSKIDPNYKDTIHVIIVNRDESFLIRKGSRIAQLTFYQTIAPFFKQVEELNCENRGGALGHSGIDRLRTNRRGIADDGNRKPARVSDILEPPACSASEVVDVSNTDAQSVQPPVPEPPVDDTGMEPETDLSDIGVHI